MKVGWVLSVCAVVFKIVFLEMCFPWREYRYTLLLRWTSHWDAMGCVGGGGEVG